MIKCKEIQGRIFEAEKTKDGGTKYPVIIISQGLGNLADKNYYSEAAIKSGVSVYEGRKAYFDHPTPTSEREMPNRSVRELAGHYENVKAEKDDQGLWALKAEFVPLKNKEDVTGLLDHAIAYKKKYPEKDYVGISINGDGEGEVMPWDDFINTHKPKSVEMEKLGKIEGSPINVIVKLTDAVSADLVTEPGARGRVLLEQEKKTKRRLQMIEAFKKLFRGIESNDKKTVEEAVKGMLNDEGKKEDENKEAESMKQAEGLAKALLNCKKEMKKEESESEEQYEAKCIAAAMKQMAAGEKKENDDKDADDEKGKEKGAEESHDKEADKKEADGAGDEKPADGDKHDDEKQDIALIKKMMGELESLKKEVGEMKAAKEKAESEAGKSKESEIALKMKLELKERSELIDRVLAESGLPRKVTNEIRGLVEKCKTEKEIKETVTRMKEAHAKAMDEILFTHSSNGFVERVTEDKSGSTDHLF